MNFKFWEWFKKKEQGNPDLKFWEWFQLKKKTYPDADPTDLAVLQEYRAYQNAVAIQRAPMETISRFEMGEGVVIKGEVSDPNFTDSAETLKRKLQYSIHQSVLAGPDTVQLDGVRAIAESMTVVGKVNKERLYELGYDIKEENAKMVKDLGLEIPGTLASEKMSENELLAGDGVNFAHYSGKPEGRPIEMQPTFPPPEEFLSGTAAAVAPALAEPLAEATALIEDIAKEVAAFHAMAKEHDISCDFCAHFQHHIDEVTGDEFDCLHICTCKGKHGD